MIKEIVVGIVLLAIVVFIYYLQYRRNKKLKAYKLPQGTSFILFNYVPFYRELSIDKRKVFEERMRDFLARTRITGVEDVQVHNVDLVFIAASAIIPVFSFPKWRYSNLSEILVYSGTFNKNFELEGANINVLGMVGDGTLNRHMILSQPALRAGFLHPDSAHNTAIHEFVHLIDKADGAINGIPDYLLNKARKQSWINQMRTNIQDIRSGFSDINPYAGTNEAEFFAVVSEYFFNQPTHLELYHPELYSILKEMYQPNAA